MLGSQNPDGTWGGPDGLDRLITTCHVTMTLMAVGVAPDSDILTRSLRYLADLDTERHTTFYWRSGPLLNVRGYERIVQSDIEHIARFKYRAGGNPNYPAPFFLLKLIRFAEGLSIPIEVGEVVDWIIGEWDCRQCWYDRTSITSMGLALLADLDLVADNVMERACEYLLENFDAKERARFSDNIVDDAFTVYNLFERYDVLKEIVPRELWAALGECAKGFVSALSSFSPTPPPFGGSVDSREYATSVLSRAIMAHRLAEDGSLFEAELAVALTNETLSRERRAKSAPMTLNSFWGEPRTSPGGFCFVLMPFSPPRRTEIYEDYIAAPLLEQCGISCRRADDIYASSRIMEDVWDSIHSADFIVADLSGRNANVFYELGLAHAVGTPVILVAESSKDIPFDLKGVRTIIYGDSPRTWKILSEKIVAYAYSITREP
ncbi:hypothetical protein [Streptomyces dubilierae]|uniref:Uncharacterized protein n=1 Tax=Streptomyces dubilierae TaxID=3075533 RepID=A0ABU2PH17_9ACTN|nr:hypothetical protein [Streptomyces sp. DSM 41921]MDT0390620.1 hypothetical protein [Streptomyces sp. DSM 41921]